MSNLKEMIDIDKTLSYDVYNKEFIKAAIQIIKDECRELDELNDALKKIANEEISQLKQARDDIMASGLYKEEEPIAIPAHKQWKPQNPLLVRSKKAQSSNVLAEKQKEIQDEQKQLKAKIGELQKRLEAHGKELMAIENAANRKLDCQVYYIRGSDDDIRRIYPQAKFTRGGLATFTQINGIKAVIINDLGIEKIIQVLSQNAGAPFNKAEINNAIQKASKIGLLKFIEDKSVVESSKELVCSYGAFTSENTPQINKEGASDVTEYITQCMHVLEATLVPENILHEVYVKKGEKFKLVMMVKAAAKQAEKEKQKKTPQNPVTPPPPKPLAQNQQADSFQNTQEYNPGYKSTPKTKNAGLPNVDSDSFW